MTRRAGRVAAFASIALVAVLLLQLAFQPRPGAEIEAVGILHDEGRRPSAVAFVQVSPGRNAFVSEGLSSTGPAQFLVVDARYAQAAREGAPVPTYVLQSTRNHHTLIVPDGSPSTVAFVWRATADFNAQQQDHFRRTAEGMAAGTCCLHGWASDPDAVIVAALAAGVVLVLVAVSAFASRLWWLGQPQGPPAAQAADLDGRMEAAHRNQGYVRRLRQLTAWLTGALAALSALLAILFLAVHLSEFTLLLGVLATFGAALFPFTVLAHQRRTLRGEEASL